MITCYYNVANWEIYRYWLVHRADYQRLLYDAAVAAGAEVILNARVVSVDDNTVSVKLQEDIVYTADLIIGADGIYSKLH
jgi:salicylate hydroxylase